MPTRPSTRDLQDLPTPLQLQARWRSLALLDAIMEPEWDMRFFSFEPSRPQDGAAVGTMRDGEGNFVYGLFLPDGAAVLRGFAHDAPMNPFREKKPTPWPGLTEGMPPSLLPHRDACGVEPMEVTFVIWHDASAKGAWETGRVAFPAGKDPDGSARLLSHFDGEPRTYVAHATSYWAREVALEPVRIIFDHGPIDESLLLQLNPEADAKESFDCARSLGFEVKGPIMTKRKKAAPPVPAATATEVPVPEPKKKINMGHAIFTIEARGDTIKMTIANGTVAEAIVTDRNFYTNLFNEIKAKIQKAGDA